MKILASLFGLVVIGAVIGAVVGWIINLVEVITFGGGITETTEGVLMLIGTFVPPLGAVMGLFV